MATEPRDLERDGLDAWAERYAADARAPDVVHDAVGRADPAAVHAGGPAGRHRRAIGLPGEYPFTRGVYPSMYRGRLWTMRQFAGFGTAEETNERFRYLLDHGQTGLSTAFDMPSPDGLRLRPRALARRGRPRGRGDRHARRHGDAVRRASTSGRSRVSMTINAPAAIMMAYYVVAAEEKGVPRDRLGGTIQADILKEYIAQKEWCFPVDPAMRLLGRHDRVVRDGDAALASRSASPATTSARRDRRRRRSSPSRSRTASPTSSRRSTAASTSTTSRRA